MNGGALHVFLSSDASSKIFAAVWHISAAWFLTILVLRHRIQNYFRIESHLHSSPFIQVECKQDELVFLEDGSKWMSKLREYEKYVIERLRYTDTRLHKIFLHGLIFYIFRMNIIVETYPVRVASNNLRYFEFQCMRYIYNKEKKRFEPYEFDLGSTNKQLRSWSNGNSTSEATYRQELLGPNIIPVYVPSIPWAIVQE